MSLRQRHGWWFRLGLSLSLSLLCLFLNNHLLRAAVSPSEATLTPLTPREFNELVLELGYPLFWAGDHNHNQQLDPAELAVLWWSVLANEETKRSTWVKPFNAGFTPRFQEVYRQVLTLRKHLKLAQKFTSPLLRDFRQSYFTLLSYDFTKETRDGLLLGEYIVKLARLSEQLYLQQNGSSAYRARFLSKPSLSRTIFYLHQSPTCSEVLGSEVLPCSLLREPLKIESGLYPPDYLQKYHGRMPLFCQELQQAGLTSPFSVVVKREGKLVEVPYNLAYLQTMHEMSTLLKELATKLSDEELALKNYLWALALAYVDNDWAKADAAWILLHGHNSRWYLRMQPDEVYFEPCNTRAGFHLSFGKIDQASLVWQEKLTPLTQQMEHELATRSGPRYSERQVAFKMPDFVEIILNAGDSRHARGATIGQSLPNFGAAAGQGRTVVISNLYRDSESQAIFKAQREAVLCKEALAVYPEDITQVQLLSTLLHEASHNLGPLHEQSGTKQALTAIFGGPLASMLEELKAQTSALFLLSWLTEQGLLTKKELLEAYLYNLTWAMGHISRGLYDHNQQPKPYGQLAAIQLGFFTKHGLLSLRESEKATHKRVGRPRGTRHRQVRKREVHPKSATCLAVSLDSEKWRTAVDELLRVVLELKSAGDRAKALELVQDFIHTPVSSSWGQLRQFLTEGYQGFPKATFLYSLLTPDD